ncbi:gag-pol [Brachionus plicatilis]|uniref:Gag-pol n=1 Tax=Brachionus plicatilis TaxID=10195 RepID=A0A3M7R303_BRAPC|nr:gag-pol [Brachionus plicatilis]
MDNEISVVKLAIKAGDRIDFQDVKNANQLMIERGTLYLKSKAGINLVIVPKHKQLQSCSLYHDAITSGHLGFEKTFRSLEARSRYLSGIKIFVYDYCKSCNTCQKFKLSTSTF